MYRWLRVVFTCFLLIVASRASAQSDPTAPPVHEHGTDTSELFSSRDGSGTSWLPDASPMFGLHRQSPPWETMVHGNVFVQYLNEGGEEHRRGQQALEQPGLLLIEE